MEDLVPQARRLEDELAAAREAAAVAEIAIAAAEERAADAQAEARIALSLILLKAPRPGAPSLMLWCVLY